MRMPILIKHQICLFLWNRWVLLCFFFCPTHRGRSRSSTWGRASRTSGQQRWPLWEESTGKVLHCLLCFRHFLPLTHKYSTGLCHKQENIWIVCMFLCPSSTMLTQRRWTKQLNAMCYKSTAINRNFEKVYIDCWLCHSIYICLFSKY